jgi:hypothetical protein
MTLNILIDILGWVGAVALLVAYALISRGRFSGHSVPYQVLNVVGSVGLIVNTIYYGAYPSTFVNVVWIAIAILTLRRVRAMRPT